jgi:Rrf2 family protein
MNKASIRYAIFALIEINNNNGAPVGSYQLSDKSGLSRSFFEQVLRKLRVAGLIKIRKGPGNGAKLNKPLNCISLADVIKALNTIEVKGKSPIEYDISYKLHLFEMKNAENLTIDQLTKE